MNVDQQQASWDRSSRDREPASRSWRRREGGSLGFK
jgi:hypothetical protein